MNPSSLGLRELAEKLKQNGMRCNCNFDAWEPEKSTGHSCVCRIHKTAITIKYRPNDIKDVSKLFPVDEKPENSTTKSDK